MNLDDIAMVLNAFYLSMVCVFQKEESSLLHHIKHLSHESSEEVKNHFQWNFLRRKVNTVESFKASIRVLCKILFSSKDKH